MTIYNTSNKDDVVIYKIDIFKQKSLAKEFSVRVIPTAIYFKNDEIIYSDVGVRTPEEIKRNVKEYLLTN